MKNFNYAKEELSETQSKMTVEYGNEKAELYDSKEVIDFFCNTIAHLANRVQAAETECSILQQSSISATDYAHLQACLNDMSRIMGMDNVVDYDKTVLKGPMFSFQEFFVRFGYFDPDVELRPVDYKNMYYEYCEENNLECETLGHRLPISFLEDLYGVNMRSVAFPGTSTYVYHIGIDFDFDRNNMIEAKVVDDNNISNIKIIDLISEDDLSFVTIDEICSYCEMNEIECKRPHHKTPYFVWLKDNNLVPTLSEDYNTFSDIWGKLPHYNVANILKFVKNDKTKAKIIIDANGGIEKIYEFAKFNVSLSEISRKFKLINISPQNSANVYVTQYVSHYGFRNWTEFSDFVKTTKDWGEFKQKIMERISSN